MKTIILAGIFSLAVIAPSLAGGTNTFADEKSKGSYAVGMMIGHTWQQQDVDVDLDWVLRGLKDVRPGGTPLMTPQEMHETLKEFQQAMIARHAQMEAELAAKNKADGVAFLATNKTKHGVVTLPDGLQYKILTNGAGAMPTSSSIATVNYRGTFIDGTEFDSSAKSGHPAQFEVDHVIPGWTEALQKMKAGSKWQLFIPSELAYGEQGNRAIPPNSTLVFDVELLSVEAQSPPAAPPAPSQPLSSDIIKVQGTNVQYLKPEDVQKLQAKPHTN